MQFFWEQSSSPPFCGGEGGKVEENCIAKLDGRINTENEFTIVIILLLRVFCFFNLFSHLLFFAFYNYSFDLPHHSLGLLYACIDLGSCHQYSLCRCEALPFALGALLGFPAQRIVCGISVLFYHSS